MPCVMDKPHRGNPIFSGVYGLTVCDFLELMAFGLFGVEVSRGLGLWEWILLPLEQCM